MSSEEESDPARRRLMKFTARFFALATTRDMRALCALVKLEKTLPSSHFGSRGPRRSSGIRHRKRPYNRKRNLASFTWDASVWPT